ncbi:HlyD family efflux transporter periplasmic adaptor subunit [Xanthomonas perforans]|nr:HlyD family efflux transporter periplasmic adaptor subunit [Xanthomonas perforans]MBZ2491738.1 HlyD family efflux transporter periplasmic adaptor subunit [Xanthomonas perforans]MBZ2509215.1 HlyD family efflux transporter periplasmic adaptor subunit [Xanthomonas perforans]MBZ2522342.1 HlyD family efflux transporter periplasmic adaptor subunit [Xanthomonas perforans]MBZ2526668.1 HlyD family efflux transporter periplasmic adaptor subunit [Xanthomonas perforans]
MIAVLAFCVVISIVIILIFFEYAQRSKVHGHLVSDRGISVVAVPVAGIVGKIYVNEGDVVSPGQEIGIVYVPRSTVSGQEAGEEALRNLKLQRDGLLQANVSRKKELMAREQGYRERLQAARHEVSQLNAEIDTRKSQVHIGEELVERYKSVVDEQYVSVVQLKQQEQAVLELKSSQQSLERQKTVVTKELSELEQSLWETRAQSGALRATEIHDLAVLEQELVNQGVSNQILLRAPVAGVVASRLAEPGEALKAGQSFVTVLPKESILIAQLSVPSRAIGFIKPGNVVLLRYMAFPFQKFGLQRGRVLRISRNTMDQSQVIDSPPGSQADSYYRVLAVLDSQSVKAYGDAEQLRPGMQLEADIITEKRKLYEWLIEPLYSVKGFAK